MTDSSSMNVFPFHIEDKAGSLVLFCKNTQNDSVTIRVTDMPCVWYVIPQSNTSLNDSLFHDQVLTLLGEVGLVLQKSNLSIERRRIILPASPGSAPPPKNTPEWNHLMEQERNILENIHTRSVNLLNHIYSKDEAIEVDVLKISFILSEATNRNFYYDSNDVNKFVRNQFQSKTMFQNASKVLGIFPVYERGAEQFVLEKKAKWLKILRHRIVPENSRLSESQQELFVSYKDIEAIEENIPPPLFQVACMTIGVHGSSPIQNSDDSHKFSPSARAIHSVVPENNAKEVFEHTSITYIGITTYVNKESRHRFYYIHSRSPLNTSMISEPSTPMEFSNSSDSEISLIPCVDETTLLSQFYSFYRTIDPDIVVGNGCFPSDTQALAYQLEKKKVAPLYGLSRTRIQPLLRPNETVFQGRLVIDLFEHASDLVESEAKEQFDVFGYHTMAADSRVNLRFDAHMCQGKRFELRREMETLVVFLAKKPELWTTLLPFLHWQQEVLSKSFCAFDILEYKLHMAEIDGCPLSMQLKPGIVTPLSYHLLHRMRTSNVFIPPKCVQRVFSYYLKRIQELSIRSTNQQHKGSYKGGCNLPVQKGIYVRTFHAFVDAQGAFPSQFLEYNLCLTNQHLWLPIIQPFLMGNQAFSEENDIEAIKKLKTVMPLEKKSPMFHMFSEWRELRKDAKQKKQHQLQLIYKLRQNGMYGSFNYEHFRIPMTALSALVSMCSRYMLYVLRDSCVKVLGHPPITGDTDGIGFDTGKTNYEEAVTCVEEVSNIFRTNFQYITAGLENMTRSLVCSQMKQRWFIAIDSERNLHYISKSLRSENVDSCPLARLMGDAVARLIVMVDMYAVAKESNSMTSVFYEHLDQIIEQALVMIVEASKARAWHLFVIRTTMHKTIDQYRSEEPFVRAAKQLASFGKMTQPGECISYVMCFDPTKPDEPVPQHILLMEHIHEEFIRPHWVYYLETQIFNPIKNLFKNISSNNALYSQIQKMIQTSIDKSHRLAKLMLITDSYKHGMRGDASEE